MKSLYLLLTAIVWTTISIAQIEVKTKSDKGYFYSSLEDFLADKPMPNVLVKSQSFKPTPESFQLIDDQGNVTQTKVKNLPSDLFTYHDLYGNDFLIRRNEKNQLLIVLVIGSVNLYSSFYHNEVLGYSEGWDGELKKLRASSLRDHLDKYRLYESYKAEQPKREKKESENLFFNRQVSWYVKYINLINQKSDKSSSE